MGFNFGWRSVERVALGPRWTRGACGCVQNRAAAVMLVHIWHLPDDVVISFCSHAVEFAWAFIVMQQRLYSERLFLLYDRFHDRFMLPS